MFFTPETPSWLGSHGRWDAARQVLERLGRKPLEIEQELNTIRQAGEHKEKGTRYARDERTETVFKAAV